MKTKIFEPLSIPETAAYLGISEAALRKGEEGTDVLTRVRLGRTFEFLLQEVTALRRERARSNARPGTRKLALTSRSQVRRVDLSNVGMMTGPDLPIKVKPAKKRG